jgi:hypothetical protein
VPDLVLENVSQELYDELRRAAETNHRSVAEEAMARLKPPSLHLPDEPSLTTEILAPCTIPMPGVARPVKTKRGGHHLPDLPWITTGDR